MYTFARIALATAFAAVTSTTFAAVNPLDPSYYVGKPAVVVDGTGFTRYVDVNNPLTPSHFQGRVSSFEGTAATNAAPYRDDRNPLSPSFVKNAAR